MGRCGGRSPRACCILACRIAYKPWEAAICRENRILACYSTFLYCILHRILHYKLLFRIILLSQTHMVRNRRPKKSAVSRGALVAWLTSYRTRLWLRNRRAPQTSAVSRGAWVALSLCVSCNRFTVKCYGLCRISVMFCPYPECYILTVYLLVCS